MTYRACPECGYYQGRPVGRLAENRNLLLTNWPCLTDTLPIGMQSKRVFLMPSKANVSFGVRGSGARLSDAMDVCHVTSTLSYGQLTLLDVLRRCWRIDQPNPEGTTSTTAMRLGF